MAENSKIEWCHDTRNLWWGCVEKSEGCRECYARGVDNHRAGGHHWGKNTPRLAIKGVWKGFNKSQNHAVETGKNRRVFVGSMMDIFERDFPLVDREGILLKETTHELRLRYFVEVVPATPNLYHMLLTKRPENIGQSIPASWFDKWPPNVWIGTSIENQKRAEERIPILLKIPAKVRFLSCEPLLEEIDLTTWLICHACGGTGEGYPHDCPICGGTGADTKLSWVICGGESGPKRRPFNPDWARSIRDQCKEANIPYFFKQIDKVKPIPDDLMIREFPNA